MSQKYQWGLLCHVAGNLFGDDFGEIHGDSITAGFSMETHHCGLVITTPEYLNEKVILFTLSFCDACNKSPLVFKREMHGELQVALADLQNHALWTTLRLERVQDGQIQIVVRRVIEFSESDLEFASEGGESEFADTCARLAEEFNVLSPAVQALHDGGLSDTYAKILEVTGGRHALA